MYPTDLCWETGEFTDDCCCDFCEHREVVIDNKDIALWHARNDNPQMRVRHILEYIENGEMVGKDVLEYDASTDKWHRIEAESIELV